MVCSLVSGNATTLKEHVVPQVLPMTERGIYKTKAFYASDVIENKYFNLISPVANGQLGNGILNNEFRDCCIVKPILIEYWCHCYCPGNGSFGRKPVPLPGV